jgi:hypothetical protein
VPLAILAQTDPFSGTNDIHPNVIGRIINETLALMPLYQGGAFQRKKCLRQLRSERPIEKEY